MEQNNEIDGQAEIERVRRQVQAVQARIRAITSTVNVTEAAARSHK